ncbi:MAG TPA: MarR family winged helix-turn-helix transcriptional regulator [Sphingomicrobium sp.]|nr:MarR family winged helix-turn-helix transcriptional regulator [Sphingomicrobium sp.]
MDTISTPRANLQYSDRSPILIVASSEQARMRALETTEGLGWRIADATPIETARGRIERQVSTGAVWLELDRDCGEPMDELLTQVAADVASGRYAAVVSSTAELVDPILARVDESEVELIVEAGEVERATALMIATARKGMGSELSDIASDQNAARLRQLSDEVNRIAATLARISASPPVAPLPPTPAAETNVPEVSAETVRSVIRARRLRTRYFADHLFADPAWDMLLDLLQAEIGQLRVPVSSLCIAAAVPATTALRWLKTMVDEGIFVRRADPHDGRRVFVELAPETSAALRRYFAEVGATAVI